MGRGELFSVNTLRDVIVQQLDSLKMSKSVKDVVDTLMLQQVYSTQVCVLVKMRMLDSTHQMLRDGEQFKGKPLYRKQTRFTWN